MRTLGAAELGAGRAPPGSTPSCPQLFQDTEGGETGPGSTAAQLPQDKENQKLNLQAKEEGSAPWQSSERYGAGVGLSERSAQPR